MPKLRHIAIAAEDPVAMAEFYKKAFDFVEVDTILRCHVNLLYVTECIILHGGHQQRRSRCP